MPKPMSAEQAIRIAESWLALPNVAIVDPGPRHQEMLFQLIRKVGVAGNLTTDAHLAVLAIENQAQLASSDSDFSRFPGLRWTNPLDRPRKS